MSELALASADVMGAYNAQNHGGQNTLIAKFYTESVLDEKATHGWNETKYEEDSGKPYNCFHKGAGITKYREAVFVEIRVPGSTTEIRARELRPSDKQRFPAAWERFEKEQAGIAVGEAGTPLELLAGVSKSQCAELRGIGIFTLENLRDCSDVNGQKILMFNRLREKATALLAAQEGNAPIAKLQSQIDEQVRENAALKEMVERLTAPDPAAPGVKVRKA